MHIYHTLAHNVPLYLAKLHLVHAFPCVPMQEGFTPKHGDELFVDSLEQFLNGGRIADERTGHPHPGRRDVANGRLHVVRDPLDKVRAVPILHEQHMFVDLFHRHLPAEYAGDGEVATVAGITGGHHIFAVEHLLREVADAQGTVLLRTTAGEWSKAWHEKVETRKWYHVDCQLSQVSIQL